MNRGVDGLMTLQESWVVHGILGPHQGLKNMTTLFAYQANVENDMMTPTVEGNMDAKEHVSSLVRISTMLLQDGKDTVEENPN